MVNLGSLSVCIVLLLRFHSKVIGFLFVLAEHFNVTGLPAWTVCDDGCVVNAKSDCDSVSEDTERQIHKLSNSEVVKYFKEALSRYFEVF